MAMPRYGIARLTKQCWCRLLNPIGVSLFFAIRGIATDLRQVVDLTEIKHVDNEDKIISEGTEEGMRRLILGIWLY